MIGSYFKSWMTVSRYGNNQNRNPAAIDIRLTAYFVFKVITTISGLLKIL